MNRSIYEFVLVFFTILFKNSIRNLQYMGSFWAKRQQNQNQSNLQEKASIQKSKQQNLQLFTYGNAVFSLSQNDYEKIDQINESNFRIFFQPVWSLEYRQFQTGNWSQVFKRMIQSSVQILALFKSGSSNIIKEIEHIKFTNIEILSLGANKIHSIEALAFMDIDILKALRLNENFITSIQPLKKLKCKNLQILLLEDNQIIDFDDINRIKFNSLGSGADFKSKLSLDLRLSEQTKAYTNQIRVDIGFLMKIQLKTINHLRRQNALVRSEHLDCLRRRNNSEINII